jgi:hypothetical protein
VLSQGVVCGIGWIYKVFRPTMLFFHALSIFVSYRLKIALKPFGQRQYRIFGRLEMIEFLIINLLNGIL